jgi:hypothetical protein
MPKREIHCDHNLPITECPEHYAEFLAETTVGDVLDNRMYGKSAEWRDGADQLLEALAHDNQYIVSDIMIMFLESSGYGLDDYSPLGGVFKRASKKGLIKRVNRPTKQAIWASKIYRGKDA